MVFHISAGFIIMFVSEIKKYVYKENLQSGSS